MSINSLRPLSLKDFVGQEKIKHNLKIFLKSAEKRNIHLDHTLMCGGAGMGKTSLSMIIANELNQKIKIIQGPHLQKISDLMSVITSIDKNSLIFIDEIHSISKEVEEILYSIIEDFSVDITIGKEMNTKIVRVKIPKFTLIGATTKFGKLENSFLDRFGIIFNFKIYSNDEISKIVKNCLEKNKITCNEESYELIASYSRNNPRIAIKISHRIVDYAYSINKHKLTHAFVLESLNGLGYYEKGLEEIDINYLKVLIEYNEPVGIENLSIILDLPKITIQDKIEQFLINNKFIKRSKRGRTITNEGIEYIKNI